MILAAMLSSDYVMILKHGALPIEIEFLLVERARLAWFGGG